MAVARIDGQPADLRAAIAQSARLLDNARSPLIAGLGADVAGLRSAMALAARTGAAFDHLASDAVLADLSAMRDAGWMTVSPAEIRRRADLVLLAGPVPEDQWALARSLLPKAAGSVRVLSLGSGALASTMASRGYGVASIDPDGRPIGGLIAALRARMAGRRIAMQEGSGQVDAAAEMLAHAKFGVAIWASGSLHRLEVEMLAGLVKELNAKTRFTAFSLPASDNGAGAALAAAWTTGFPMRTGFVAGKAEHDPWRFDGRRMTASGEADLVLWLSAYRPLTPPSPVNVPLIAVTAPGAQFATAPAVEIEVGVPGVDHDAVDYCADAGGLAPRLASRPSDVPPAAAVLDGMLAALPARKSAA